MARAAAGVGEGTQLSLTLTQAQGFSSNRSCVAQTEGPCPSIFALCRLALTTSSSFGPCPPTVARRFWVITLTSRRDGAI